ncbi:hypothetical protein FRB96_002089 [Tulasnella sp. 330]|nr:hypothetical protein FRB96_002089 [Tulasnella sp. 330]KAG8875309.1 hypothetical protein FRB97_005228 [Tulasnella sp. 331]KAG8881341.1 hypothetical protein FRB98_004406 [Tulasnella sp. 332]
MAPAAVMSNVAEAPSSNGYPTIEALKATAKQTLLNGTNGISKPSFSTSSTLLSSFLHSQNRLQALRDGESIVINGNTLSVPEVVAAGRYGASVVLDDSHEVRSRIEKSQRAMDSKLESGKSVYGVSTGFGGTDTRTNEHLVLGKALLQHQHAGVLPNGPIASGVLPLGDPVATLSMPEAWVRSAILVRINSLIRGHSGVRWDLMEAMIALLRENITPFVPLRGSISASGDLSPLSYIAGTLIGNPFIRVWDGPKSGPRQVVSSCEAYAKHGLEPLVFSPKEHLGLLNGTAFSAAVASLALNDAVHLALMTQVLTAMGTEALIGTQGSHDPFIHKVARPHPGQVEAADTIYNLLVGSKLAQLGHEEEVTIEEDAGTLRQDRYSLRTAPQFIGPQLEDLLSAYKMVTQECNSTTDNPLVDGETGNVHHGGNFQAMHVTNAMEKTRLSLHHFGKLLFSQSTELLNPMMNRGLPPNLAATDPAVNYHCKGLDIATAAYVSELGYLANPVSTHIQSAEMHNQSVNSLALISARATINSLDVLTLLVSSYLYIVCQALDLRAMNSLFQTSLKEIIDHELSAHFGAYLASAGPAITKSLKRVIYESIQQTLDTQAIIMDIVPRMQTSVAASTTPLVDFLAATPSSISGLEKIPAFRKKVVDQAVALLTRLREEFLSGARGPAPAAELLGKTRPVYEYVRVTLGVKMHGNENATRFDGGFTQATIGQNVSNIYESIRDGKMQDVIAKLF